MIEFKNLPERQGPLAMLSALSVYIQPGNATRSVSETEVTALESGDLRLLLGVSYPCLVVLFNNPLVHSP